MTPPRPSRLRRVRYSFASLGWRRGFSELTNWPYAPEADTEFDLTHGTDTAGSVEPGDLGIDDVDTTKQAIRYLPSPLRVTSWMLAHVGIDPPTFSFVDLGCGKGRVVLLAAQHPFRHITGVEISTELAAIARGNVADYRPPSSQVGAIEIVNSDARDYDMPAGNLLIHMYHPFDPAISATVFERLAAAPTDQPRRIVVAYLTYTHSVEPVAQMFARFPWLGRVRYEESIRGQYNWLFYEGSQTP